MDGIDDEVQISLESAGVEHTAEELQKLIDLGETMARKYWVTTTNLPYMGAGSIGASLLKYIKENYYQGRTDLFAVFMKKCKAMTRVNAFFAMITMQAWMFQSSFLELRGELESAHLESLIHLGAHAFDDLNGEVVQTATYVFVNGYVPRYVAMCIDATTGENSQKKEQIFFAGKTSYRFDIEKTKNLPGKQYAYWISDAVEKVFVNSRPLSKLGRARRGLQTGDAPRFIRLWF